MKQTRRFRPWWFAVAAVLATATLAATLPLHAAEKQGHKAHWGYEGNTGPDQWGALSDEFSLCAAGRRQSPVDLTSTLKSSTASASFHYNPSPLNIVNNGHTIQINYEPGSYAEFDGKRYELLQFHFHSPSEHTVDGKHIAMEAHLVHRDAAGNLAVVGVFLKQGQELAALRDAWNNLPPHEGEKTVKGVSIDVASLLPKHSQVYSYSGSLTTPPCSEGVSWFVMADPLEVSARQIEVFRATVSPNARPVQALNGRGEPVALTTPVF